MEDLPVMAFTRCGAEVSSLMSLSKDIILSTILHLDNRDIIDSVDSLRSEELVRSISNSQKGLVSPYVNFICPQSYLSALMIAPCEGTVDMVRERLASGVRIQITYGNDRQVMPGFCLLMVSDLPDSQH